MTLLRSGSLLALVAVAAAVFVSAASDSGGPRFVVTYGADKSPGPLDGRVLLLLSTDKSQEPRFQISDISLQSQQVFGIEVDGWKAGQEAVFPADVLGYPVESLAHIPAGTYQVQALLHRYETFHRSDGHTVKLPPDRGEGQQWSRRRATSIRRRARSSSIPRSRATIRIALDRSSRRSPIRPTTKYVKHERIVSQILSKFWGRTMYLGAHVLLPEGFDEHPERALSARDQPRAFPRHDRGIPRGAARSEPQAGLLRPLPPVRLQPHPAGDGLSALQGLDRARLSRDTSSSRSSTPIRTTTTPTP